MRNKRMRSRKLRSAARVESGCPVSEPGGANGSVTVYPTKQQNGNGTITRKISTASSNGNGVIGNGISTHQTSANSAEKQNGNGVGPHHHEISNGQSATLRSFKQPPLKQKSELLSSPSSLTNLTSPTALSTSDVSSNLKYIIILGAVSTMAAVGITSAQDWLAFLVISAQLGAIALVIWALLNYRWFYVAAKTLPRDIKGGLRYAQILINVGRAQRKNLTAHKLFQENVKKHPNKVCLYFEEEVWTFKDVDDASNKVANFFTVQGLKKGDSVALYMENRPEYVCMWLGLCKVGVIPALINFNLRLQSLKHSIEVAESKAIVYGHELAGAIQEIIDMGIAPLPLYSSGHGTEQMLPNAIDLDAELQKSSAGPATPSSPINFSDKLLYIFTSGTTGLPKAAVVKHSRFLFFTMGIHYFIGVSNDEIIYDPLPLYHTAGGMIGVGQALIHGCTAVIRRKFSATAYFKDCAKYKCTAAQYIGEICRYLLCQAPTPDDTKHKVKLMFGNGLRPQIWESFAKRFNIKTISEFYGATEGNCNIININNHVGAVGFISMIAPFIYPVTLIRVDEESGEPIRDHKTGLVLRCKPNEPGELVGKIVDNHPVREFDGYADSTSTTKKIVRNVFRKGDAAFRTGDVLVMDEFGYFFFKDRTGDTFRWKGENCSTAEVEAVVSNVCGLKDAVVYGVEIPGSDGRAGMAAILDPDESLDLEALAAGVTKSLPAYARPLFIRIVKQMDMTGTYKMKKVDLQKEGFDVTKISDKILFFSGGKYIPVDNELYSKISSGQMRL